VTAVLLHEVMLTPADGSAVRNEGISSRGTTCDADHLGGEGSLRVEYD